MLRPAMQILPWLAMHLPATVSLGGLGITEVASVLGRPRLRLAAFVSPIKSLGNGKGQNYKASVIQAYLSNHGFRAAAAALCKVYEVRFLGKDKRQTSPSPMKWADRYLKDDPQRFAPRELRPGSRNRITVDICKSDAVMTQLQVLSQDSHLPIGPYDHFYDEGEYTICVMADTSEAVAIPAKLEITVRYVSGSVELIRQRRPWPPKIL